MARALYDLDLWGGLAAMAWSFLGVDAGDGALVPQCAALCSPMIAGPFAIAALVRWYNTYRGGKS